MLHPSFKVFPQTADNKTMLPAHRPIILVVDDDRRKASLIESYLKAHYSVIKAHSGEACLDLIKNENIDLAIIDVALPGISGYDVCKKIKGNTSTRHIPVILIPALATGREKTRSIQVGAEDFIDKPFSMHEVVARTGSLLRIKQLQDKLKDAEDAFLHLACALSRAAEANEDATGKHIVRLNRYSVVLAEKLRMPEKFIQDIGIAAQLHDVGKMHLNPDMLKKPGELSSEEFETVKQHPIYGAKILGEHPKLKMAHTIALTHHETWDGSGYPYGLKGDIIPMEGRILNIADQYDALRSARPYKPAYSHEKTFRIITEGDGKTMPTHFDPAVLNAFMEVSGNMEEIYSDLQ